MHQAAAAGALLLALATTPGLCRNEARPGSVLLTAREDPEVIQGRKLAAKEQWTEVEALLARYVAEKAEGAEAEGHELLASALLALGRRDEAAVALEAGMTRRLDTEGSSRIYRKTRDELWKIDPVARARSYLVTDCMKLLPTCEELVRERHLERVLPLLEGLELLATGSEKLRVRELLESVRRTFRAIDLDAAGSGSLAGIAKVTTVVGEHYRLEANLEDEVAALVKDTMDDIFGSYVQIYLDGDASRAATNKVGLRIHRDSERMKDEWPGGDRPSGLGGWWEPLGQRVVCYDTRTDSGTLDVMLGTLFHEASHQFMTMLGSRGGWAPAWLNEGTASFFEGAKAMADRRVLWPDAARSRLESLFEILTRGLLTAEAVLGYKEPGSYPGIMYPYGWGLVYFLQEYEHPDTLEYVWRPYYAEYREMITRTSPPLDPLELFREVFLRPGNPGGFTSLDDFERGFRDWIVEQVHPLHFGAQRRERRLARADRYVAAADQAASRGSSEREAELLLRALRDVVYLRTEVERDPRFGELVLREIEILRRLGRAASEAAAIELVLDLVDAGEFELPLADRNLAGAQRRAAADARYEELAERMYALDKKNETPRKAMVRVKKLRARARELLVEYEALEPALPLRAQSFASVFGAALGDQKVLLPAAARLRVGQRIAAHAGAGVPVDGKTWAALDRQQETSFTPAAGSLELACERGAGGRVCTDVATQGDFELRGRLVRRGELRLGVFHGVVVHGVPGAEWLVVVVDSVGRVRAEWWREGGTRAESSADIELDEPVGEAESPTFAIRVEARGHLSVCLGERPPVELDLERELAAPGHVGAFVKKGTIVLEGFVIETAP